LAILAYIAALSLQLTVFNLPPQQAPTGKTTRMSLQQYATQKVRPMLRKLRLSRQQMIGSAAFMRRTSRKRLSLFIIPSLGIPIRCRASSARTDVSRRQWRQGCHRALVW
jgi:hypothetical protein